MAKLLPKHILPPLENAQNHLLISSSLLLSCPIHLSGIQLCGSGNTSAFRCNVYADELILTPPGILSYPSIVVPFGEKGVIRGCGAGAAERRRSVSRRIASRSGRASTARGEGSRSWPSAAVGESTLGYMI